MRTRLLAATALLFAAVLAPAHGEEQTLLLATTTSVRDSGLLDELLPVFTEKNGKFATHYSRTYVEAAQTNPAVSRLRPAQD